MAGGEGGAAIVAGKPGESPLWERVESGEMPPKVPLDPAEKAALRDWIAAGATWGTDPIDPYQASTSRRAGRDWWSLKPVRRPAVPEVGREDWPRSPIDRFVLRKLEAEGLRPAPEADPRVLIRRLRFDLTGLPPTPEEVDAFLADREPGAYERLVDRLLASPDHGVRWARWWLDLARFGETNGFEHDEARPNAWRYRDWAVDELNRDLPYDVFARLQIAGDAINSDDPGAIAATGFLVAGGYDAVGQSQQSEPARNIARADELEDIIAAVGQSFLGLTVNCARCHDHKFDPIRQAEYYRFAAALDGVRAGDRDLPRAGFRQGLRRAGQGSRRDEGPPPGEPQHPRRRGLARRDRGRRRARPPTSACRPTPPRHERRKRLAGLDHVPGQSAVRPGAGQPALAGPFRRRPGRDAQRPRLQRRHSRRTRSCSTGWPRSSSRRGWSLKAMHRQIVTSSAPIASRRGSTRRRWPRTRATACSGGRPRSGSRPRWSATRCWPSPGPSTPPSGGPGFHDRDVSLAPKTSIVINLEADPAGPGLNRRSLYRWWGRSARSGLLDAFDCPDPSTTAPKRAITTTPLQALALMNNALVLHLSDAFAARLSREDEADRVDRAYRLAYAGRRPDPEERARARPAGRAVRPLDPGPGPLQLERVPLCRLIAGGSSRGSAAGWRPRRRPALMLRDGTLQASVPGESDPRCPHFAPKAKRAIHICLCGAMSQVDSFDHKPGLIAAHGQSLKTPATRDDVFFGQVGLLRRPDWDYRQGGQSGLWISDLFPNLREVADELTVIRSMVADTANHTPATFQQNSGFRLNGYPALGLVAELRPGQRVGRPARLRRDPRRPRVPRRRGDQLVQRLPARAASRGRRPPPGHADRRPLPRPEGRARGRRGDALEFLAADATAGTSRPGRGRTPSRPGSRGTSWPRGCRPRSRWSPTSTASPPRPGPSTGSTAPRPPTSAGPA